MPSPPEIESGVRRLGDAIPDHGWSFDAGLTISSFCLVQILRWRLLPMVPGMCVPERLLAHPRAMERNRSSGDTRHPQHERFHANGPWVARSPTLNPYNRGHSCTRLGSFDKPTRNQNQQISRNVIAIIVATACVARSPRVKGSS